MTDISKIRIAFPNAGTYSENDPCFTKELRLLREELNAPNAIKSVSVHETGHLIYFRSLGKHLNIAPEKFKFIRPSVTYELKTNGEWKFGHFTGATETPFTKDTLTYTDEVLMKLAEACVAGGIFSRELAKGSLIGDADDLRRFRYYYDSAIKQRGQMDTLRSELVARATQTVIDELQNSVFQDKALLEAARIEAEILL